jgi:hypothetical protein
LSLVAVPFIARLALIERRGFNPDELEHSHLAYCISKGQVPYRDYFEHHTPLLHYMLARLYASRPVESDPDEAIEALFDARRLMWAFTGLGLALTLALARTRNSDPRVAATGLLLLANAPFFLAKSLEIRPDVPAFALLVGGVAAALAGVRHASRAWLLTSGLLLGCSLMFTQKTLFAMPGLALAALASLAWTPGDRRRPALAGWLVALAGAAIPIGAVLAFFAARGALRLFVDDNFLINARWPGLGPGAFLLEWLKEDPLFIGLGAIGLGLASRPTRLRTEPFVPLTALSLLLGFAVLPAVTFHYFLLLLPFMALLGGDALVIALDSCMTRAPSRRLALAALFVALALVLPELLDSGLPRPTPPVLALEGLLALTTAWALTRGRNDASLALCLLLLSAVPLVRLRLTFSRGNWGTIQGIRYVLRNSAPWDTCLDGFTGLGVFRPHAFFYPFQHWHTLAIQTESDKHAMIEALRSGAALPKLVFWNHYLEDGMTPELTAFISRNYVPAGIEPIRVRPFDNGLRFWSDEAPRYFGWVRGQERAPHTLFDDKWRIPSLEDGVAVRRTRTARSGFILPIQRVQDFHVRLHARADAEAVPFDVELVLNGASLTRQPAVAGWHDYELNAPAQGLIQGFNAGELRFETSKEPKDRRLELAVEYLQLSR